MKFSARAVLWSDLVSGGMTPFSKRHVLIVPAIVILWVALVLARLVDLQVLQHAAFRRQARRQQEHTVEVSPVRGMIYDRNSRPLAMSIEVESIFAVPAEIPNPESTAKLLASALELEASRVLQQLRGPRFFRWIKRKVSAREAARIRQLNLQGIHFQKESKRFYPKRELAAHVLGHVGLDDNGLAGIELRYEKTIRGRPGQLLIEKDARQRWFSRSGRPPEPGENVVLTLDENIQYIAERELAAGMRQYKAVSGSVLVQDPQTGEILAMANQPTFNPNTFSETDPEAFRNLAVSAAYEPGSTFKIVTMAAVLEEKLADPEEHIDCQMGHITLAGHTIRDYKPFSILTVQEILQYSSDVGTIKLGLRLGKHGLYRYLRDFGFGRPTGIELPGESRGLTKPPERWSRISIGAISMGQEIGVTPLQLVTAASVVANGGRWIRPRIVQQRYRANQPRRLESSETRRVISAGTAAAVRRMMVQVVQNGTGRNAQLEGYTVAGKTGTAEKIDPATGAYSPTDNVASFVAFVPAESPVFTILVVMDSPREETHGGDVAAPMFRHIAEQALAYRNVPATAPGKAPLSPRLVAAEPGVDPYSHPALSSARSATGLAPVAGAKLPAAALPAGRNSMVRLSLDSNRVIPSFLGKTVRAVAEQSLAEGFRVQVIGRGIAYEQTPLPGSPLLDRQKVIVRFRVGGTERGQQPAAWKPSGRVPANKPSRPLPGARSSTAG